MFTIVWLLAGLFFFVFPFWNTMYGGVTDFDAFLNTMSFVVAFGCLGLAGSAEKG